MKAREVYNYRIQMPEENKVEWLKPPASRVRRQKNRISLVVMILFKFFEVKSH